MSTAMTRNLMAEMKLWACSMPSTRPSPTLPAIIRLEQLPGGTLTHWKAPPCHGAPRERTFASCSS